MTSVKSLALLLAFLLFALAKPASACVQPAANPCDFDPNLRLGDGSRMIEAAVTVPLEARSLERPLTVRIAALASSEVFWNGRLIGRNGVPGDDARTERPGRYFSTITVPAALVRPGENRVLVRLSAERLWLPVRDPVHHLSIGLYETPALPGRAGYLPALLALGALATALAYFAFSAAQSPRRDRQALLLAAIAGATLLQLGAEVSRAFVNYAYPWQLGRLTVIAVLAAITAVLIAAAAANWFASSRRRLIVGGTAVASVVAVLLSPGFDLKAVGALSTGFAALGTCGLLGVRSRVPAAGGALCASVAAVLLLAIGPTSFLDRNYYLGMAAGLVGLVVVQVRTFRTARMQLSQLEDRLRQAEEAGEPVVALKQGARTYRVLQSDILFARAADDYCEVRLKDGRTILVTTTLGRLLALLPEALVRVHKSYAVSRAEVVAVQRRPNGGRQLSLSDGSTVPLGRSYAAAGAFD